MLNRSWRGSTEAAYSSAWRIWNSWCVERNLHPLSAPLSEVLQFLLEQFLTGKQYRTLNTIRSAISMTHRGIEGVPVGQHQLVSRFMKGVLTVDHQPLGIPPHGMWRWFSNTLQPCRTARSFPCRLSHTSWLCF